MRAIRRSRGLILFALVAVAGCGGGVSPIGTKGDDVGPGNPGDDLVGDDEIPADGGPADDGPSIDPRCVSGAPIGTSFPCNVSGLTCPLGTISDCNGNQRTLECFCGGAAWSCDPVPT